ncbi:MAG: hypothetical protein IJ309_07795 [Clostridia bacterium]|nr:hypothetical protein [Clostridia bacterium]MBQ7907852.1 hypothetical protein [Clostridia bacterium]
MSIKIAFALSSLSARVKPEKFLVVIAYDRPIAVIRVVKPCCLLFKIK